MDRDKLLTIIQDESAQTRERVEAGDALSKLSDPRPGVGVNAEGIPYFAWSAQIKGGSFSMGSTEDNEIAFDNEKPKHSVTYGEFCISIYPVTNTQFRAFTETEGGWNSDEWWTADGVLWRRNSPLWQQGNNPGNYPCINVNWYAAVAYTNWVSSLLNPGTRVRLPTEPEWERAARGTDNRNYPWGNEFDHNKCNMKDTDINDLCSVGLFLGGKSPSGAFDMVGGTWEWCLSLSLPYSYNSDREGLTKAGKRVIRGGAYNQDSTGVRCTVRREDPPEHSGNRISFRLVRITESI